MVLACLSPPTGRSTAEGCVSRGKNIFQQTPPLLILDIHVQGQGDTPELGVLLIQELGQDHSLESCLL